MNIGTLQIEMAANIARLRSDMDEAKRVVGTAMGDVERYVNIAKTAFVALGGVLSVNAFASAIDGVIEFKARLVDLSSQTGISVEALGALGKTGKLTGTSLDDITAASAKLSKAIATSTAESKGAALAIQALGLDFDRFKQLRAEDQLLTVARAMNGFADGTGKTAAAMELFGKTGAQLLPFLRDLSDRTDLTSKQTREAAERAKEYEDNLKKLKSAGEEWKNSVADAVLPTLVGWTNALVDAKAAYGSFFVAVRDSMGQNPFLTLDERLKNTQAQLARLREMRDAPEASGVPTYEGLYGLGQASNAGLEREIVLLEQRENFLQRSQARAGEAGAGRGRVNPPLIQRPELSLDIASVARESDAYLQLVKSIQEKIATDQAELDSVEKLTEAQKLQAKVHADIDGGYLKLTKAQKENVEQLLNQLLVIDKLNTAKEKDKRWLEETRKENERALEVQSERVRTGNQLVRQVEDELEAFGKTRAELQALSSARDRDSAASLRQRASMLDTEGELGELRDLYLQQADALERLAARKDQLAAKEARESNESTAGATRAVRDYLEVVKRAGDATYSVVSNSIASLEDGVSGLAARKKFDVAAWVDQIIQEMFRLAVVRPLLREIFGGGSSAGGGGFLGQAIGAVGSIAGSWFGGLTVDTGGVGTNNTGGGLPTRGGLAVGGQARAGGRYLVGENGPELLQMGDQGGTVIPNGGAARPVTVNLVNNGAPVSAKAQTRETPQGTIVDLILDTVAHDVAAGGRVADAHVQRFGVNSAAGVPRR